MICLEPSPSSNAGGGGGQALKDPACIGDSTELKCQSTVRLHPFTHAM